MPEEKKVENNDEKQGPSNVLTPKPRPEDFVKNIKNFLFKMFPWLSLVVEGFKKIRDLKKAKANGAEVATGEDTDPKINPKLGVDEPSQEADGPESEELAKKLANVQKRYVGEQAGMERDSEAPDNTPGYQGAQGASPSMLAAVARATAGGPEGAENPVGPEGPVASAFKKKGMV